MPFTCVTTHCLTSINTQRRRRKKKSSVFSNAFEILQLMLFPFPGALRDIHLCLAPSFSSGFFLSFSSSSSPLLRRSSRLLLHPPLSRECIVSSASSPSSFLSEGEEEKSHLTQLIQCY
ncbi:hypothetical protein AVEN_32750-1 [Araneus ventricosus]|uniref:Uncharacterized protein n=1 Tax=Araneus ventricosus TaxID=182803 RepID=A0A4Y2CY23_ARAVE|nr:hypothetical protein AVEN_32750-1 [Araneus ventricosus]